MFKRNLAFGKGARLRTGVAVATFLFSLFLAGSAAAVPVDLVVETDPDENGFGFSFLHAGTSSCEEIGDVQFCKSGGTLISLTGTLSGDRVGNAISSISGTIFADGVGDIIVTGGFIDFDSSAADTFGGELVTSTHGTFYFLDHNFAGVANSLVGDALRLWGNNWNNVGATGQPGNGIPLYGIDLGITVTPIIPEPGTALLMGLGLIGLARRPRA